MIFRKSEQEFYCKPVISCEELLIFENFCYLHLLFRLKFIKVYIRLPRLELDKMESTPSSSLIFLFLDACIHNEVLCDLLSL